MSTGTVDAQGVTAEQFLAELFEFENCEECGRDADAHTVSLDMFGNWHAWCETESGS